MNRAPRQNGVPVTKMALIIAILFLLFTFFNIDRSRVKNDESPLFAMAVRGLEDGASRYYVGIGYGVVAWRIPAARSSGGTTVQGFNVGKELIRFPECYAAMFSESLTPGIDLTFTQGGSL